MTVNRCGGSASLNPRSRKSLRNASASDSQIAKAGSQKSSFASPSPMKRFEGFSVNLASPVCRASACTAAISLASCGSSARGARVWKQCRQNGAGDPGKRRAINSLGKDRAGARDGRTKLERTRAASHPPEWQMPVAVEMSPANDTKYSYSPVRPEVRLGGQLPLRTMPNPNSLGARTDAPTRSRGPARPRESRRIAPCSASTPRTFRSPSAPGFSSSMRCTPGRTGSVARRRMSFGCSCEGTPEQPIRTLDCGCGNAYFSYHAVKRHSRCTGITIHEWEKHHCEEMRSFLDVSPTDLEFRVTNLAALADDPAEREKYDQVLFLDVIEHILDAGAALRQIHTLLAENGLVYITTPNRDWQGNASRIRVTRIEDGWHLRNGYTFEQLESLLEDNGFEPVDRLRFGSLGSTLVTRIQHGIFGRWIDPLTVIFYPLLKLIAMLMSCWPDPHTIFVLARKRSS